MNDLIIAELGSAPLEIVDGDRGANYPKQADFRDTGYCLFLNTGNVTSNGFDFSSCKFITEEKDMALRKGKCVRGDVVLTTRGTVGNVAYFDEAVPFDHIRINSGMVLLRPDPLRLSSSYLYFFLRSNLFKEQVSSLSTGTAQPQLPIRDIRRVEIPIPTLLEQQAIAQILGTLDDKIELNRRMNETLESMARAIFQSWFVDFDPVRAKAEGRDPGLPPHLAALFPDSFENAELGEIPAGWRLEVIGNVARQLRKTVHPSGINPLSPYIGLDHMPRRCIALSEWGQAAELQSNKFAFERGDILFGKLRPYFHKVGIAPVDGVCSTDVVVIGPKQPQWFGFVLGHVSSEAFVNHTDSTSTGTRMPRTNWQDMARYRVVIPPSELASVLTELTRPSLERINANIHESHTLAALRDTLLPRLMSGELRVREAERVLEEVIA